MTMTNNNFFLKESADEIRTERDKYKQLYELALEKLKFAQEEL